MTLPVDADIPARAAARTRARAPSGARLDRGSGVSDRAGPAAGLDRFVDNAAMSGGNLRLFQTRPYCAGINSVGVSEQISVAVVCGLPKKPLTRNRSAQGVSKRLVYLKYHSVSESPQKT